MGKIGYQFSFPPDSDYPGRGQWKNIRAITFKGWVRHQYYTCEPFWIGFGGPSRFAIANRRSGDGSRDRNRCSWRRKSFGKFIASVAGTQFSTLIFRYCPGDYLRKYSFCFSWNSSTCKVRIGGRSFNCSDSD